MTWLRYSWSSEVRAAAVAAAIVVLGAGALSWDALSSFAREAHVRASLSWIYPIVVDGEMATGTVAALALRAARLRTRIYIWTLIGAGVAVSVAGNAWHSSTAGALPPALAACASAVPACALAASLHLLVTIVRHAPPAHAAAVPSRKGARPDTPRSARADARSRVRVLINRAREEGTTLTGTQLGEKVGVSPGHARRLRAEVGS